MTKRVLIDAELWQRIVAWLGPHAECDGPADCDLAAQQPLCRDIAQASVREVEESFPGFMEVLAERDALKAMLDRISMAVVDYFHAPNEECVADGVDAVLDDVARLEAQLAEMTAALLSIRDEVVVLPVDGGPADMGTEANMYCRALGECVSIAQRALSIAPTSEEK